VSVSYPEGMSWISDSELEAIGFRSIGSNVLIDSSVVIHNAQHISLGSSIRIDAFAILLAGQEGLIIGNHVHIAPGSRISGTSARVSFGDFSGVSGGVAIYTATDDYRHGHLTNPTVPAEYRSLRVGSIALEKHAIVGANSVLLPGVVLGLGSSVGALTLVNSSVPAGAIVSGNPMRKLGERDVGNLWKLEEQLLAGAEIAGD